MTEVGDPGNGSPDWTELPLNGICGATAGNSHRKQTATTAITRTSDRRSLTGHGPGITRQRAPYISAHRPHRSSHIRRRKTACPGDAPDKLGEHDIPLVGTEPGMAGGHRDRKSTRLNSSHANI